MNPTLEQLVQYISQELEKGIPEATLHGALSQRGWTDDWINAGFAAYAQPKATRPAVPEITTTVMNEPAPYMAQKPAFLPRPEQPNSEILTIHTRQSRAKIWLKVAIILLVIIGIAAGSYYVLAHRQMVRQQKTERDATRRDHLAIMLNDLSDYYVAHSAYPTNNQMSDVGFLTAQGFDPKAMRDPLWSGKVVACAKQNAPVFAPAPAEKCYAYRATTLNAADCGVADAPCKKMTISIFLEETKKSYVVTFDQNSEVDE